MNKILRKAFYGMFVLSMLATACSEDNEDIKPEDPLQGITDIDNPYEGKEISSFGATITLRFEAADAWEATVSPADAGGVSNLKGNETGGASSIRVIVEENKRAEPRKIEVIIKVKGYDESNIIKLTQAASGDVGTSALSKYLNEKMHECLSAEYLWRDAYNEADEAGSIDMSVSWDKFLGTNLLKLGDVNLEDGGVYRAYHSQSGNRYIYSYISEVNNLGGTRGNVQAYGLGIGPLFTARMQASSEDMGMVAGYVYDQSPAFNAGLRRGDIIYMVNGSKVTTSNYQRYAEELFYNASGAYDLTYYRYEKAVGGYQMKSHSCKVSTAAYPYNPILFSAVLQPDKSNPYKIGYLATESFELGAQDMIEDILMQFKSENIGDLILDLRFNVGGAVAQCRYLCSSIVGAANYDKTFAKMTFCDGREEVWNYGYGDMSNQDGLGQGPDLGLKRLYVIQSENTASAAEIVINSLRGIGFEVHTYGSRSEGKNVGMVTRQISKDGRAFEFAPINFYVKNAEDFGDYGNGLMPDNLINNQNTSYDDDIDSLFPYHFGDWGNLDFNPALWWVYCDIMGEDPGFNTRTRSASVGSELIPVSSAQIRPTQVGRFGNVIYK